jgi:ABC-type multidrug transport system fused ATPase/permease subunit
MIQLKAMFRKEWFIAMQNKKREIGTMVVTILYGVLLGYECSISLFDDSVTSPALGYVLIILLAPGALYQINVALVTDMTTEKMSKMRETLKIMGLNQYIYALSHMSVKIIYTIFLSFLMSLFMYLYNLDYMSFGQFVALLFAFTLSGLGNLVMSLVLQNFFENPKMAQVLVPLLLFFPSGIAMLAILLPTVQQVPNNWIGWLFFLPQFPFTVELAAIFDPDNEYFNVPASVAWVFSVILIPAYFFLHIYLENVIPNTFGVSKSCCFCFKKKKEEDGAEEFRESMVLKDSHESAVSQSLLDQRRDTAKSHNSSVNNEDRDMEKSRKSLKYVRDDHAIKLNKLTKKFGDFTAVNKLSLSIDRGEIFSILGHNGAGKTTAIYMLTGMYDPTRGDATIDGLSIRDDIHEVR